MTEDHIEIIDWNLFSGIFSAASGEVVPEDALAEALKTIETQKIFPDGTIGRKITTSDLREFLTTYGDDPLTDEDAQELIHVRLTVGSKKVIWAIFWADFAVMLLDQKQHQ